MAVDIRGPKLEGTVHVNMALTLKFMAGYLFGADASIEPPERQLVPGDDEFLFRQGPARGLSKIRFGDWRAVYERRADVPNVARFAELADSFKNFLAAAAPDENQQKDLDYLLTLGELFTLIPYGQLIIEQAELIDLPDDTLDQIFDVLIRDFSAYATQLHGKASATRGPVRVGAGSGDAPATDDERTEAVWRKVRRLRVSTRCARRGPATRPSRRTFTARGYEGWKSTFGGEVPYRYRSSAGAFGISLVIFCIVPRNL